MAGSIVVGAAKFIGARVETASPPVGGDGSTRAPMTPRAPRPTVEGVKLPADLPMRNFPLRERRSPVLRLWGIFALGVIFVSIFTTKPYPGLSGDGAWVTVGVVLLAAGVALSMPRRELPPGRRFAGLCLVSVAGIVLLRFQPHGAGFACLYYVMAIAGL